MSRDKARAALYAASYHAAHREQRAAYNVAYRAAHREELKAKRREYVAEHRDAVAAANAAYHVAHRDSENAKSRAYSQDHRAELEAYAATHPEMVEAANRKWRSKNPDKVREYRVRDKAKRRGARSCSHASCLAIGAATLAWQVSDRRCHLCGVPVMPHANLHMDHVIPIARGGIHCAENLRPACPTCNHRKGPRVFYGGGAAST